MKLLAYILMTICLTFGTLAATTAYSPSLSRPDEALVGLTLNADAGVKEPEAAPDTADAADTDADHEAEPIAGQDDEITPALLTTLRNAGVERVRVKEFSFARWDHWWLMAASCAGLVVAAMMLKLQGRREIAAKLEAPGEVTESPEHALKEIRATIESVLRDLPSLTDPHQKMELILDRIGGLQWTHTQAIIDARTSLIGRLKLGGYAEFMDRFSAFERQLNRAWSAAADGVVEESVTALEAAQKLAPQVEGKLRPSA